MRKLAGSIAVILTIAGTGQAKVGSALQQDPGAKLGNTCPATLSASTKLPAHSRVTGRLSARSLALNDASISWDEVETANPMRGLAEVEADSDTATRRVYRYDPQSATALVCRYGAIKPPMLAEAVLVTKLAESNGMCTFIHPHAGRPASMRCEKRVTR